MKPRFCSGGTTVETVTHDPVERSAEGAWFHGTADPMVIVDDVPMVAADHVRDRYPSLLDVVGAAADVTAESWPAAVVSDGARVRSSFRDALVSFGVRDAFPGVLASTVDVLGESLQARPVAAPPYVVVTSTGVLLRATLDDCRLVVELRAFEHREGRYHRRDSVTVIAWLV